MPYGANVAAFAVGGVGWVCGVSLLEGIGMTDTQNAVAFLRDWRRMLEGRGANRPPFTFSDGAVSEVVDEALFAIAQLEADLAALRDERLGVVKRFTAELDEVRAERDALRAERDTFYMDYRMKTDAQLKQAEADLAALRQRHAREVKAAFGEGYDAGQNDYPIDGLTVGEDAAWLASEAKARLTNG